MGKIHVPRFSPVPKHSMGTKGKILIKKIWGDKFAY